MPRHKTPIIISYFTNNWEYPKRASLLRRDCEILDFKSDIVELSDQGSWIQNTRMKSRFVHEKLEEHKRPVIWIDVDSRVLRAPHGISPYADFAAVRAKQPADKTWYAGTLFFNYTDQGREFARRWAESSIGGSDHAALEDVWRAGMTGVIHSLPPEYCDTRSESAGDSTDVVIRTGRSTDNSKREYFRKKRG